MDPGGNIGGPGGNIEEPGGIIGELGGKKEDPEPIPWDAFFSFFVEEFFRGGRFSRRHITHSLRFTWFSAPQLGQT